MSLLEGTDSPGKPLPQPAEIFCADWGEPPHVYLSLDVVDGLAEDVASSPDRTESGGLLLGRVHQDRRQCMEVWDYLPVRTENGRAAPSMFSPDVRAFLKGYVTALRRVSVTAAIGYYRKFLGSSLQPAPADTNLCRDLAANSWNLVLLISSRIFGPPAARFCFWDGAELATRRAWPEFPLDRRELTSDPASVQRLSANARPFRRLMRWIWCTAAAAVVVLVAAVFLYRTLMPPPMERLRLRAVQTAEGIHITWNANAVGVFAATGGVLSIQDGEEERREVRLSVEELRNGSVTYFPEHDDVEISLNMLAKAPPEITERILVAAAPKPEATLAAIPKTMPDSPPSADSDRPDVGDVEAPIEEPASMERILPVRHNTGRFRNARFSAPPRRPASQTILQPPSETVPREANALPALALALAPPLAAPGSASLPGHRFASPGPFVPARPIERVRPSISSDLRRLLVNDLVIDIEVTIDKTGTVVNAKPVADRGPQPKYLVAATADAARRWRFEPAKSADAPVTSTMILSFKFK